MRPLTLLASGFVMIVAALSACSSPTSASGTAGGSSGTEVSSSSAGNATSGSSSSGSAGTGGSTSFSCNATLGSAKACGTYKDVPSADVASICPDAGEDMFVASCDMTGVTGTCTVSAGADGTAKLYFYGDGDAGTESAQEYCKGIGGTYTAG